MKINGFRCVYIFLLPVLTILIIIGCAAPAKETAPAPVPEDLSTRPEEPAETESKIAEPETKSGSSEYYGDKSKSTAKKPAISAEIAGKTLLRSAESKKIKAMKPTGTRRKIATRRKGSSGLKAGVSDDNKQFNYFINFLNKYRQAKHIPLNINERIIFKVKDVNGQSVPNARVEIFSGKHLTEEGKTYADGTYMFFPSESGENLSKYTARISYNQDTTKVSFKRNSRRKIEVNLKSRRGEFSNVPVDILFVLDTTGSMGEEISRLKKTIEIINLNISSLSSKPDVRFGMVLYRDRKDNYVTKVIPLTKNLDGFIRHLDRVRAGGGGDRPEDLQSALKDSITQINWNPDGIRIGFVITDAPPHLDYGQEYTYVKAVSDAKKRAIKLFSIGTGGLNLSGEYVLRQISQYTYSKYIFLTYGEKGESHGGRVGSVSHHTGSNYQTDKLEAIIIRIAKEEISHLTNQPLEEGEDYFQADKIEEEKNEDTLKKLFDRAISQLVDYSTFAIKPETAVAVTPITVSNKILKTDAEYFTAQLLFSFSRNTSFKAIERNDLQKVLTEMGFQMTGLVDEKSAAKTGKLLGAKMIITGKMVENAHQYILFLKLINVETAEILSVTKLKINKNLGTSG